MERKKRFQTRSQYAEQKVKDTKFQKANNYLNYLIGLVAVLIVITLWFILSNDSEPAKDIAEAPETPETSETVNTDNEPSNDNDSQAGTTPAEDEKKEDEPANEETNEQEETQQSTENETTTSSDPIVAEVQTNPNWKAYPTQQTGEHVSTFEKGHIDYEEKLKAIFSVTDLEQSNSIVLSVRNNGNAQSAIAVVTSMDKVKKYRVSIVWVDGEGWKPVQLEVLNSLEGI